MLGVVWPCPYHYHAFLVWLYVRTNVAHGIFFCICRYFHAFAFKFRCMRICMTAMFNMDGLLFSWKITNVRHYYCHVMFLSGTITNLLLAIDSWWLMCFHENICDIKITIIFYIVLCICICIYFQVCTFFCVFFLVLQYLTTLPLVLVCTPVFISWWCRLTSFQVLMPLTMILIVDMRCIVSPMSGDHRMIFVRWSSELYPNSPRFFPGLDVG